MWQRNNGHTTKDEIQNHFTGYLLTAIKRKKEEYIGKLYLQMNREVVVDEIVCSAIEPEPEEFESFPIMHRLDNTEL